jgi:predicted extracellular nuclease
MQIQNPNEPGHPKKDDPVALEGVIVTTTIFKVSANLNGFFVSAPSFPDKFGGVMVVVGIDWTETLQIGDELNISGRVTEYFNNTQIQVTISQGQSITKTGNNKKDQIKAIEVQAADIKAIPADDKNPDASPSEAYEGMLVELKNVIIEDQYLEGTKKEFKGSWTTTDGVIIANTLFDIKPTKGDKYSVVRGVIQYTFNAFRLLPRSADDVQKTP